MVHLLHDVLKPASDSPTLDHFHRNRWTNSPEYAIGVETANRQWISYEIERSITRNNGLLGIRIDAIKDQYGKVGVSGPTPDALVKAGAPIYVWEYGKLALWVADAYKRANP